MPEPSSINVNLWDVLSFKGRMRRKHFALVSFSLIALLIAIVVSWQMTHIDAIILSRYVVMAAFIPYCVRRLHDIGYTGWLTIAVFIIPLALIPLLIIPGTPGTNRYGADPKGQTV